MAPWYCATVPASRPCFSASMASGVPSTLMMITFPVAPAVCTERLWLRGFRSPPGFVVLGWQSCRSLVMDVERNFGLANYRQYAPSGFLRLKQRQKDTER